MLLAWDRGVEPVSNATRSEHPATRSKRPRPRRFIGKLYHTMTEASGGWAFPGRLATPDRVRRDGRPARAAARAARRRDHRALSRARYGNEPVTAEHADRARSAWKHVTSVARRADIDEPVDSNG